MPRGRRPPGIKLISDDRAVDGQLGSYVWASRAVDSLIEVPPEAATVMQGTPLRFEGPGGPPDEVSISLFRVEDLGQPELRPILQSELDPKELAWTATANPGAYVLGLFRAWEGRGDAIHYFAIEVAPPEGV